MNEHPVLIRRSCGGWIAISPPCLGEQLGVTASTKGEAIKMHREALARWRAFIADAASSHTIEQI